jgi:hypothetical protein
LAAGTGERAIGQVWGRTPSGRSSARCREPRDHSGLGLKGTLITGGCWTCWWARWSLPCWPAMDLGQAADPAHDRRRDRPAALAIVRDPSRSGNPEQRRVRTGELPGRECPRVAYFTGTGARPPCPSGRAEDRQRSISTNGSRTVRSIQLAGSLRRKWQDEGHDRRRSATRCFWRC